MIPLSLLAGMLVYGYAPGSVTSFDVKVDFEGYLPLLGGKNGKANVEMRVLAAGIASDKPGLQHVESQIESLSVKLNSTQLPLTKSSIESFFPKATVVIEPTGKVLENTAPKKKLPVKLPGLDSQRFPDISFLPIQFSDKQIGADGTFTFTKKFNGSDVAYKVTLVGMDKDLVTFKLDLNQDSTEYEDDFKNPVEEESAATFSIKSHLTGTGIAVFDTKRHLFKSTKIEATNDSNVTQIKTQVVTTRQLKTILRIDLVEKPESKALRTP